MLSETVCYRCKKQKPEWENRWAAKGYIWCKRLGVLICKQGNLPTGCPYELEHLLENQNV